MCLQTSKVYVLKSTYFLEWDNVNVNKRKDSPNSLLGMSSFEMQSIGSPKYCLPKTTNETLLLPKTFNQKPLTCDHKTKSNQDYKCCTIMETKYAIVDYHTGAFEEPLQRFE